MSYFFSVSASLLCLGLSGFTLLSSPYTAASSINPCSEELRSEALSPNNVFVADWGVRVNRLEAKNYGWEDVDVQQRPEIEYEQDVRVVYDPEDVSLTKFWQGCESFIGRQEQCESDESLSMVVTPDLLNATLLAQGSQVTNSSNNITSFFEPYEEEWQVSENPILEEIFNLSMTEDEIDALGDFTQLGIRQAIRITVDVGKPLEFFNFDKLQLPYYLSTSRKGLFIESKIILKTMYIADGYIELPYIPYRTVIEGNNYYLACSDNTCSYEFLTSDITDLTWLVKNYSDWTDKTICTEVSSTAHGLGSGLTSLYSDTNIEEIILHYEIQTSIINSKKIENFNPLNYLDRDLTLPKEKSGGSLYYLLLMLVLITLFKKTHSNHQRIDRIIKGF